MISISHSPNSNWSQQKLAFALLCLPWKWSQHVQGNSHDQLKKKLKDLHHNSEVTLYQSGRSALYAILRAMEVQEGDEVIIQGYTCIVVPNAVVWSGAKPVYVDIDDSYNLDPQLLEQAITPKTKAIIVQHTFGVPADMEAIKRIADTHNIALIEDCAHSLGAKVGKKAVGTIGDAAILSFGRDKIISSVSGGAVIATNPELANKLTVLEQQAPHENRTTILQNLLHPLLLPWMTRLIGPLKIGQLLIILSQKLRLLNKVYSKTECETIKPQQPLVQLPNAMAALALDQLKSLETFIAARKHHAKEYQLFAKENNLTTQSIHPETTPVYLRFALEHMDAKQIIASLSKKGYLLGNWYKSVIMPEPISYSPLYYTQGSCPRSEELAKRSINLPTQQKLSENHRKQLLNLLKASL